MGRYNKDSNIQEGWEGTMILGRYNNARRPVRYKNRRIEVLYGRVLTNLTHNYYQGII